MVVLFSRYVKVIENDMKINIIFIFCTLYLFKTAEVHLFSTMFQYRYQHILQELINISISITIPMLFNDYTYTSGVMKSVSSARKR